MTYFLTLVNNTAQLFYRLMSTWPAQTPMQTELPFWESKSQQWTKLGQVARRLLGVPAASTSTLHAGRAHPSFLQTGALDLRRENLGAHLSLHCQTWFSTEGGLNKAQLVGDGQGEV